MDMIRSLTAMAWRYLCVALLTGLPLPHLHAQTPLPTPTPTPTPTPESVLGFEPGADSMLADWTQIGEYLTQLSAASPRVRLDTIGRTTLARPLLLLTFASPANQRRLAELRHGQALLADPRRMSESVEDSLVGTQPVVVLINNNIHSTEIASSQMQLTLAYRLAADPRYRTLLDSMVILMIPSANPDGLDTVVSWYREYRGTPYEGGPLPWLYHPYVGHDNNRDWFMLTQVETQAITRVLYREWFPEIVWDIHQMGNRGARLFVPPFSGPVNPNLDPILVSGINLVGAAMATAVLDAGRTGVVQQERYSLWWHGGFRTVPARHNMIGILSEAASARLASPIEQDPDSLRQPKRSVTYPAPWSGGVWRMGDIVEYELLAADGLLRLAATQRASFVRRFATLGRRAIAAGAAGNPATYVIPSGQRDPYAAATLANAIIAAGVEVHRASRGFAADGQEYGAGSLVIPMAQPFRAHVKDLLERQDYPHDRRPYDVAGWSLGPQMGVETVAIVEPFDFRGERLDAVAVERGTVRGAGRFTVLHNRGVGESRAVAEALAGGARVWLTNQPATLDGQAFAAGAVVVEHNAATENMIARLADTYGFTAVRTNQEIPGSRPIERLPRIGIYKPWTASADEGWTRWVLEQFSIPYVSVTDSMVRAGDLSHQIDVLILPDISERSIRDGPSPGSAPERYTGGMGLSGVLSVTDFVRDGGTLVTLNASSDFAISALNLPVRNVLADQVSENPGSRFRAPGSIFGLATTPEMPITSGVADTVAAFFASGMAFEVEEPGRVVARYVGDPLISGYVQAPQRIAEMAALVEVPVGRGRAVLFGFRPQHRGQTFGTFKLLFNAVLLGTAPRAD